ncbi:MAG TPA: transposase [Chitinophagaceae bacterium]|nr:transposase [Chitinophagaceae bacterium]
MLDNRIYLFVHAIFSVKDVQPLLKPSLRAVYFAWIKKHAGEKAIRILNIGGGTDHVHLLLQLHPAQNLLQVVKQVKEESVKFINESKFLQEEFAWDPDYTAFTVSPSAFAQTMDYISKQDDYHQHKTFLQEMELINKTRINTDES